MAEGLTANQRDLVKMAIAGMVNDSRELGTDGKPNIPVLNKALGFTVTAKQRDELFAEWDGEQVKAEGGPKPEEDIPEPENGEVLRQLLPKFVRHGTPITAASLSKKSGFAVPEATAEWAKKEAAKLSLE